MPKLKNIIKRHLQSQTILATSRHKRSLVLSSLAWELCYMISVNWQNLKNAPKKPSQRQRTLATDPRGEYAKAIDYFEKALAIGKETGYKKTEATSSLSLGILLKSLGDYSKSEKHLEKALRMTQTNGRQE